MFLARQDKRDRFVMRVNQQQKGIVTDWFAFKAENIAGIATQQHPNATNKSRGPFFVAHLAPARIEPHHVANLRTSYSPTLKKLRPTKHRMCMTKTDQLSRELQKLILLFVARPIEPTDLVVLTIRIVIAVLRPSPLVSTTEHRDALRKEKR